jgi:hypothetical protein
MSAGSNAERGPAVGMLSETDSASTQASAPDASVAGGGGVQRAARIAHEPSSWLAAPWCSQLALACMRQAPRHGTAQQHE